MNKKYFVLKLTVIFLFSISKTSFAQTRLTNLACDTSLVNKLINSDSIITESNLVTNETVAKNKLTIPSLWWAKEQFDPFEGKLINRWIADQNQHQIDLLINRQLWSLLNYLQRYRFMNNMGTIAREYQYNLQVFDEQQQCLATYSCSYDVSPAQCQINFSFSVQNRLQFDSQ